MRKIIFLSFMIIGVAIGGFTAFADGEPISPKPPVQNPGTVTPDGGVTPPKDPINKPPIFPETSLTILNNYYAVDDESVYTVDADGKKWIRLPDIDRVSFVIIGGQFARDADQIFMKGRPIIGADRGSFSPISPEHGYAQDKDHVYGPQGIIPDADTQTFEMRTKIYSLDIGQVYANGRVIDADSGSFQIIHDGPYAYDKYRVFYEGKILSGVSPAGFRVIGTRGITADGRVYEGASLQGSGGVVPPDPVIDPTIPAIGPESLLALIRSQIAPYKTMLQEYPKLWSLIGLATLIMFGLLFVFFGHRNDESVSLIKTIIKIAIALVISACLIWIASHFLEPRMAIIVGSLAGIFFFVTLWSALGWIRSIIMTLLTLISVIVGIALVVFIVRIFFPEIGALIAFIQTGNTQLMTILTLSGILVGAGLIASQLRSSLASALGQSTIATIVSVVILGFFLWVSALSTPITVTIFALLFGALLWIMRFRIVSDLFADSVRIFRVALLLGIIMAILVWFIL